MPSDPRLERPIFFVGAPRSGTTIIFETFAMNSVTAWLSSYTELTPRWPVLNVLRRGLDNRWIQLRGRKKQHTDTAFGNRYLPHPAESYAFWDHYCGRAFSQDYLIDQKADAQTAYAVRKAVLAVTRWQGRRRFSAKLTGPARIEYLASIFPDALFINLIRDGRAVVHSLLKVGFWTKKGGFDHPFWQGGLSQQDQEQWQAADKDPAILAALQWNKIIEVTELESSRLPPGRVKNLRYEDFMAAPHEETASLFEFCSLQDEPEVHSYIDNASGLVDMNFKHRSDTAPEMERAHQIMRPYLTKLGYP